MLTIYAELSKKQYNSILNNEYTISIPHGTSMTNNKRGLIFNCENKDSKEELVNALDDSGINWVIVEDN
jgi:hypothetical protein